MTRSQGGATPFLRVVSYNVHRCVGRDGRCDVERVAAVLAELDADVVGLQEVDNGYHTPGSEQLRELARATGLASVEGPTLRRISGHYGSALLTRLPVERVVRHDLSVSGREPRGALDVTVAGGEARARIVVTHLGLRAGERRQQGRLLLERLRENDEGSLTILLADVNEWLPWGCVSRSFDRALGAAKALRSFPARFPCLPLDRIWVRPASALREVAAHRSARAREASDHLPVFGDVDPELSFPGAILPSGERPGPRDPT